ncbi:TPA: hypothetical protein EYP44_01205 [Candidatus Bathyarchaeota archaeon]|nr:hypothetical protein [Candidatus Bathyarchaeota archaeon]
MSEDIRKVRLRQMVVLGKLQGVARELSEWIEAGLSILREREDAIVRKAGFEGILYLAQDIVATTREYLESEKIRE